MYLQPLKPLNPFLHAAYTPWIGGSENKIPDPEEAERLRALVERASSCPEEEIDKVHCEIVDLLWWYAVQPNVIAEAVLRRYGWRSPLTVDQAATVVAALGEAGFPVWGNGAPDFDYRAGPTCRGEERERVIWGAAYHWANMAAGKGQGVPVYISFGDARGYVPRPVQYDMPGAVHPMQRAALTLGPVGHADSTNYMRSKTECMLLVARKGG